jgi:hypothetical protein
MGRMAVIVAMCLILSGCATGQWMKTDEQPGDWERDVKLCEYEVELGMQQVQTGNYYGMGAAIGTGLAAGLGNAARKNKLMGLCMETKGWWKEMNK